MVIWKYVLEDPDKELIVDLPISATPLSVSVQNFDGEQKIVVYVLQNQNAPNITKYKFVAYRTGYEIPTKEVSNYHFLNTVLLYEGELMFHVFYAHESEF